MKYIAFIVLGLVLLAAIAGVVLWANMPTARLTVHAVRPMGTNVWEFAITNTGRVPADWRTVVRCENVEGAPPFNRLYGTSGRYVRLPAGQHATVDIQVSSDPPCIWRAEVYYGTPMNSLETTLASWLEPVPTLRSLLPNYGYHLAHDAWRVGTNVTTAH